MNATAKNFDNVLPIERVKPQPEERRIPWAVVAAVVAITCLAFENVRHRDLMVEKNERIAALEREVSIRKVPPTKQACNQYSVWMERMSVTHCSRTITRM